MPQQIASVTTFSCSIAKCENTHFVVGDAPIESARKMGWTIGQDIFDTTYDLCPEHTEDLKAWLKDGE